jgi:fermentation-respiration switch protein FrsA (DUF1100 family)
VITKGLNLLAALFVAYAAVVLLAWRFQERLAFPGPNAPLPEPEALGLSDGRRVTTVTADGVELHGWYLPPVPAPPGDRQAPGLIWFHGNMETVSDLAPILQEFRPPGVGLLILDYRGYGESEGTPTEPGLYRDADAAWALLTGFPDIDSTRIGLYGRSLGGAVALYLATERPVRAVILDSPFSTAREMADQHYSIVPTTLLHLRLDNLERAAHVTAPLLVVHGTKDRIAPLSMGTAVADTALNGSLFIIQGAGHNDTYALGGESYRTEFHAFVAKHLAKAPQPQ